MTQRIGSVYLDGPARTSRRPPIPRVNRTRAGLGSTFAVIGLVALSLAAMLAGVRALLLDPDPILDAFEATLDDPESRAEIEEQVAIGVEERLVGAELTELAAAYELDVPAEAQRISLLVLDDPAVREEFRALATELHSRIVIETDASDLDLAPLTAAVLDVIETESPRLAAIIPAGTTLWPPEGAPIPDLTPLGDLSGRTFPLALLAIVLLPLAAIVHPRHHLVVGWAGRWALVFGIACGFSALALPWIAGQLAGWATVEVVLRTATVRLLAPAGLAGVAGMGLVSAAAVARNREQRRVVAEGAAAALGYDEPPQWRQPSAPQLDLAHRGLVDANRTLTNI